MVRVQRPSPGPSGHPLPGGEGHVKDFPSPPGSGWPDGPGEVRYCAFPLLFFFLLLTGCGKVGDPLPPFIRIPESIHDLAVQQNGRDLVFTWTNPAKNIDGSGATDLAHVHIRSNESVIATVTVNAPAQTQS